MLGISVWAGQRDLRVLAVDKNAAWKSTGDWYVLRDGRIAGPATRPSGYPPPPSRCGRKGWRDPHEETWTSTAMGRTLDGGFDGLWLCDGARKPRLLEAAGYSVPLVSPDGAWALAHRERKGAPGFRELVRVALPSGAISPVDTFPDADLFVPLAYVSSHRGFLLMRPAAPPAQSEFLVLHPDTLKTEAVRGEFGPLNEQLSRPLQPTDAPDVSWAAKAMRSSEGEYCETQIGRYDSRAFTFAPVSTIPDLCFESSDMWVDVDTGAVYVAYRGRVLVLPLAAKRAPRPAQ
jgi:hypothetical protein